MSSSVEEVIRGQLHGLDEDILNYIVLMVEDMSLKVRFPPFAIMMMHLSLMIHVPYYVPHRNVKAMNHCKSESCPS